MANVLIRGLDDDVLSRLRTSAKLHSRSLQAEIREALTAASLRSLAETRRLSKKWLEALADQRPEAATRVAREDEAGP